MPTVWHRARRVKAVRESLWLLQSSHVRGDALKQPRAGRLSERQMGGTGQLNLDRMCQWAVLPRGAVPLGAGRAAAVRYASARKRESAA